ncbi:hypothetical protein H9L25_03350 [Terrisporobacter mayombei]|nr:hypothetical protein [Terrisporobacter mayombei]
MILRQNNLIIGMKDNNNGVQDGNYNGKITDIRLKAQQATQYGFKDILTAEVEIDLDVTQIKKNTSYYISDKEGTRFSRFLDDMKIDRNSEEFDVNELLDVKVEVTIKNNKVGDTVYSNIDRIVAI